MEVVPKELLETDLHAAALVKEANARYQQPVREARTEAQAIETAIGLITDPARQ